MAVDDNVHEVLKKLAEQVLEAALASAATPQQHQFPAPWHLRGEELPRTSVPFAPPDIWSVVGHRLTEAEAAAVARAIRVTRTIPKLPFVRGALEGCIEWDPGLKTPWWFLPRVGLDGPNLPGLLPAMVFVNHNGLYARVGDEPIYEMTTWIPFDWLTGVGFDFTKSDLAAHMLLEWTDPNGVSGATHIMEAKVPGYGGHLAILEAIREVWWPAVERFRDEPMYHHGVCGESYKTFRSWDELVSWATSPDVAAAVEVSASVDEAPSEEEAGPDNQEEADATDEEEASAELESDDTDSESLTSEEDDVEVTNLIFPVTGKSTFTLGYNRSCWVSETVIGTVDDQTVRALLQDTDNWRVMDWRKCHDILHSHGISDPATDLELPNGSRVSVTLQHEPQVFDLEEQAFASSSRGDFVHITTYERKAYGWEGGKRYSLTLTEGAFELARVRVEWKYGMVSGYTYEGEGGEIAFDEGAKWETVCKGDTTTLYFNDGTQLTAIDVDELAAALAKSGVDAGNPAAVRRHLLGEPNKPGAPHQEKAPEEENKVVRPPVAPAPPKPADPGVPPPTADARLDPPAPKPPPAAAPAPPAPSPPRKSRRLGWVGMVALVGLFLWLFRLAYLSETQTRSNAAVASQPSVGNPSFDCAATTHRVERLICGQPELAALDRTLDELYRAALKVSGDQVGTKATQRAWLAARDLCQGVECIEQAYAVRIAQIRAGHAAGWKSLGAASSLAPSVMDGIAMPRAEDASGRDFPSQVSFRDPAESTDTGVRLALAALDGVELRYAPAVDSLTGVRRTYHVTYRSFTDDRGDRWLRRMEEEFLEVRRGVSYLPGEEERLLSALATGWTHIGSMVLTIDVAMGKRAEVAEGAGWHATSGFIGNPALGVRYTAAQDSMWHLGDQVRAVWRADDLYTTDAAIQQQATTPHLGLFLAALAPGTASLTPDAASEASGESSFPVDSVDVPWVDVKGRLLSPTPVKIRAGRAVGVTPKELQVASGAFCLPGAPTHAAVLPTITVTAAFGPGTSAERTDTLTLLDVGPHLVVSDGVDCLVLPNLERHTGRPERWRVRG